MTFTLKAGYTAQAEEVRSMTAPFRAFAKMVIANDIAGTWTLDLDEDNIVYDSLKDTSKYDSTASSGVIVDTTNKEVYLDLNYDSPFDNFTSDKSIWTLTDTPATPQGGVTYVHAIQGGDLDTQVNVTSGTTITSAITLDSVSTTSVWEGTGRSGIVYVSAQSFSSGDYLDATLGIYCTDGSNTVALKELVVSGSGSLSDRLWRFTYDSGADEIDISYISPISNFDVTDIAGNSWTADTQNIDVSSVTGDKKILFRVYVPTQTVTSGGATTKSASVNVNYVIDGYADGTFYSTELDNTSNSITHSNIYKIDDTTPTGTSITYTETANDSNYETVTENVWHTFTNTGTVLKYKAELTPSTDKTETPRMKGYAINYIAD